MGKAYFLIVDDDASLLRSIDRVVSRYFLESGRDIEVITAPSAEKAISLVQERMRDRPESEWGLLTDYDMGEMSGADLIDALDALLKHRLIWRMVQTGLLDDSRRAEVEAKQAFIEEKPVSKADLESYLYIFLTTLS